MSKSLKFILIITITVIFIGVIYLLLNNKENYERVLTNTPANINNIEDGNELFSSNGLQFQYLDDFKIFKQQDNLPKGNELEIYVSPIVDKLDTTMPQIVVSIYSNSKNLSISDFIEEMKNNSVELLSGSLVGSIDESYEINVQTIEGKKFEEYLDRVTNDRTAFYSIGEKIIVISELGSTEKNILSYDLVLKTLQYLYNEIEIEDWQTVSSNIYGYEISFPKGWYWSQGNEKHDLSTDIPVTDILISPDQCYFNGDCMSSSAILVRLEVSNMVCNTSQECANYLDYSPGCRTYSDRQSITIDNYEATQQFEYPEEGCATEQDYTSNIFWKKDNSTYNLMGINVNKEDFSKYADIFEKIIKSIKFK